MNQSDCLLYLVTNSDHLAREPFLRVIEEALQNGVTLLQLREKDKDGREFYEEALAVKELAKRYHVPLLIDDRIDVALAVDADGVHVGQSDLPVSVARKLLGPGKIVGAKPWHRRWKHSPREPTTWGQGLFSQRRPKPPQSPPVWGPSPRSAGQ